MKNELKMKLLSQKLYLLILGLSLIAPLHAQYIAFTPELKGAFNDVVQLKLKKAQKTIDSVGKRQPENKAVDYLNGAIIGIKLFLDENEEKFDKQKKKLEECIEAIREVSDKDPKRAHLISELSLSLAILNARYHNNIRAGLQFYSAYNYLKENQEQFPDYAPNYIALGVLNAAIGSLPEDYQSIASLVGIKGSVEKGMSYLKKGYWRSISDNDHKFYRDYFAFIYAYTSFTIVGRKDITPESLGVDYSKSSYLSYMQSLVEVSKGNARRALNILLNVPEGKAYEDYDYLDYYTGRVAISFSVDTAVVFLNKYLEENTSGNYVKSTYRYLSWCEILKGDRKAADRYREKVKSEGNLSTGADKQALREAESSINDVLIKARILFDGGLYNKAIDYLLAKEVLSKNYIPKDQQEFHYRFGRVYQEDGQSVKAIHQFKKALGIELEGKPTFASGNSALQLGTVYENTGDKEQARVYFQKCLKIKGYPFYQGVHQKAKAGLDRL